MTKNELLCIQKFILDLQESDDQIEVLNNIYYWIKLIYNKQAKKKLGKFYIKL